jgi:membrane-associated phospholipid phosphatase
MIKIFIGGLRPHFLSVCKPIPVQHPATPNSVDWVTAEDVCTADTKDLYEVQMSFPSGHAYAAFAGFGFLSLWLNAKFKTFGPSRRSGFPHPPPSPDVNPAEVLARTSSAQEGSTQGLPKGLPEEKRSGGRIQHYKLVLFAAPWCIATLLAASKVRDGWHHPIDVIFGGLVGTLFAVWGFRMVYRGVWDQRVNHLVR